MDTGTYICQPCYRVCVNSTYGKSFPLRQLSERDFPKRTISIISPSRGEGFVAEWAAVFLNLKTDCAALASQVG